MRQPFYAELILEVGMDHPDYHEICQRFWEERNEIADLEEIEEN